VPHPSRQVRPESVGVSGRLGRSDTGTSAMRDALSEGFDHHLLANSMPVLGAFMRSNASLRKPRSPQCGPSPTGGEKHPTDERRTGCRSSDATRHSARFDPPETVATTRSRAIAQPGDQRCDGGEVVSCRRVAD